MPDLATLVTATAQADNRARAFLRQRIEEIPEKLALAVRDSKERGLRLSDVVLCVCSRGWGASGAPRPWRCFAVSVAEALAHLPRHEEFFTRVVPPAHARVVAFNPTTGRTELFILPIKEDSSDE